MRGRIAYNGEAFDQFVPQRTAAYVSQARLQQRMLHTFIIQCFATTVLQQQIVCVFPPHCLLITAASVRYSGTSGEAVPNNVYGGALAEDRPITAVSRQHA